MKIKFAGSFKNQCDVALIVVGAIIIAIPIIIFGRIRVLWGVLTFWAKPRRSVVSERLAKAAARITGQAGKRTKN